MGAYDNDPRVVKVNEYHFQVLAPDDTYDVAAWNSPQHWLVDPVIGGVSCRAAKLQTREDAEDWVRRTVRGPYESADEAIRTLIGDPQ